MPTVTNIVCVTSSVFNPSYLAFNSYDETKLFPEMIDSEPNFAVGPIFVTWPSSSCPPHYFDFSLIKRLRGECMLHLLELNHTNK